MSQVRQRPILRAVSLTMAAAMLIAIVGVAATQAATLRPVRLEAGPHTGYLFTAGGAIVSQKTVTYSSPYATQTDSRVWIPGRGSHLRIVTGALAGSYVKESMVAFIPGLVRLATYTPYARADFPAGTYLGYRFDSHWNLLSTKRYTLTAASAARTTARVLINGRAYAQITSGIWTGYWVPITSPTGLTADRLGCRAPGKVAAGSAQLFRVLPGGRDQIALTFDMGGRMDPAVDIVERLIVDRVCATIFPTGSASLTTQGKAVMALIKAHPELFEVANHTYHHCNLRDGGGGAACPASPPSSAFIAKELNDAATVIRTLTGQQPAPYWRPPYGAVDSRVRSAAAAAGYTKTFMWDIDTIDWRHVSATPTPGPTAAQIADKVVSRAVNGSNVLMHLGGWNTLDALPSMVYRLEARGLTPTTISDILR